MTTLMIQTNGLEGHWVGRTPLSFLELKLKAQADELSKRWSNPDIPPSKDCI